MKSRLSAFVLGLATAAAIVTLPGIARADSIDGDWCLANTKKYMTIQGVQIVTPGGSRTEGNYSRHAFDYVIPPPEAQAGQTVAMILVNENTVNLIVGAKFVSRGAPNVETWLRCNRPTA